MNQKVLIFKKEMNKMQWLTRNLNEYLVNSSQVIIFANQIKTVDQIYELLAYSYGSLVMSLHGQKPQVERAKVLQNFRQKNCTILVATSVAARGLDIDSNSLRTVISFDFARLSDDHIHRVGRTGRAGITDCQAITLLTAEQKREAAMLVKILEDSNQSVGKDLERLAQQDSSFQSSRKTVIGLGKYTMEIDIKKETQKVKSEMRKVGDKSGIGFDNPKDKRSHHRDR